MSEQPPEVKYTDWEKVATAQCKTTNSHIPLVHAFCIGVSAKVIVYLENFQVFPLHIPLFMSRRLHSIGFKMVLRVCYYEMLEFDWSV